jgi:hypothetical protein
MIRLHPLPDTDHLCAYCQVPLETLGWYIPGMRNLASLRCPACAREFYGDLAAGQALYSPQLLEKETGRVHDAHNVEWFAGWLREAYARRASEPLPFEVQERRPLTRAVVLLNCLDTIYGHALLKLLNAQYYLDHRPDVDLILMIPRCLVWMIPEGVAQVWVVDLPLRRGTEWNDWLGHEIHRRMEAFEAAFLSVAFSHPHPDDYDIERFTRVNPFPLDEWAARLKRPTVTFIWRDDRLWRAPLDASSTYLEKAKQRFRRAASNPLRGQRRLVCELAERLKQEWPALDFAVAGLGRAGDFPGWITDLRRTAIDSAIEREWCARYASSHVVCGAHGSNMLLPSAHAGATVELLGSERWGNYLQDILFRRGDCRETFFRYRFVPETTTPAMLADLLNLLLRKHHGLQLLMSPQYCKHGIDYRLLHRQP